jgi:IS5 family transposase
LLPEKAKKDEANKDYQQPVFVDSAHQSAEIDKELRRRGFDPQIIERAYHNNPLTDNQKENNRLKPKLRCCIKYIFGT